MKSRLTWGTSIWQETCIFRFLTSWTHPLWLWWILMKSTKCWGAIQLFCSQAFWQEFYYRYGSNIFRRFEVFMDRAGQSWLEISKEHWNTVILTFLFRSTLSRSNSRKSRFLLFWSFNLVFTSNKKALFEGINIQPLFHELQTFKIEP